MISNDAKPKESQRKQTRYSVSEDCRLRASLMVRSSDEDSANKDWPGTLVDMSSGGAHIQISMAAVAYQGDSCVLRLSHGGVKTELRGILAHYICSARYSMCGVKFDFHTPGADAAYLPYFKAVVASATLKGGPAPSDTVGQYREEYRGPGHTKLVVWRDNKPERTIVGFDYTMGRYAAALETTGAKVITNKAQVVFRAPPTEKGSPGASVTAEQAAAARWEFSLAASNLPKSIPADIRGFLRLMS